MSYLKCSDLAGIVEFVRVRRWSNRRKYGDWETVTSISAGSARALLDAVEPRLTPQDPSSLNPILTNEKALSIMRAGIAQVPEAEGIAIPIAFNIVSIVTGRRCRSIEKLQAALRAASPPGEKE
mgnify:FL=1